jgi:hypothetical protein
VGVIENMSWFVCPHCGEREMVFGEGGGQEAADTLGVPLLGQVPLYPPLRAGGDEGRPVVISDPDSPAGTALREAARKLAKSLKTVVGKPLNLMVAPGAGAGGNGHGNGHAGHEGHEGHGAHEGHDHSAHAGHDHSAHGHAGHQH